MKFFFWHVICIKSVEAFGRGECWFNMRWFGAAAAAVVKKAMAAVQNSFVVFW